MKSYPINLCSGTKGSSWLLHLFPPLPLTQRAMQVQYKLRVTNETQIEITESEIIMYSESVYRYLDDTMEQIGRPLMHSTLFEILVKS